MTDMSENKTIKIGSAQISIFTPCAGEGGKKKVFLSTDGRSAVAIYKNRLLSREGDEARRMSKLLERRNRLESAAPGVFCFPDEFGMVNGKANTLGFIMSKIPAGFFCSLSKDDRTLFDLSNPYCANVYFSKNPKGANFYNHLSLCRQIAAAVDALHSNSVIHSDLSNNNILINPADKKIHIIDMDGVAINNDIVRVASSDMLGTPRFIPPEIKKLCDEHKEIKFTPASDLFPLAIHIYSLLLHRHPLLRFLAPGEPDKIEKQNLDEEDYIFIYHPSYIESEPTRSFFISKKQACHKIYNNEYERAENFCKGLSRDVISPDWMDLNKFSSARICGPFLSSLFKKAFVDGLNDPAARPSAWDWQLAISKTINLLYPCGNCSHKYFVVQRKTDIRCPFCGEKIKTDIPILNVYDFRVSEHRFLNDALGEKKREIIVGYPGRKIYNHQLEGQNPNPKASPIFELSKNDRGYVIRNISSLDMRVVNENGQGCDIAIPNGGCHEMSDFLMLKISKEGSDIDKILIIRFVNN